MNPASNPSIAIPRSRFNQEYNFSAAMFHGDLVPLDCFEVLPGDDFTVKKSGIEIIMSTPIVPIFGNIKLKVTAFFIPMRLVWRYTEEFFGANKTSAGPQTTTYLIPRYSVYQSGIPKYSVSHYLGKPYVAQNTTIKNYGVVSVLKERAYWLTWSEWYRAQQVQNPFILNTDNVSPYSASGLAKIGTLNGANVYMDHLPAKVCKQYDIFTAATLSPQYGSAVELPLGTYAPVIGSSTLHSVGSDGVKFAQATNTYSTKPSALGFAASQSDANKIAIYPDSNLTSGDPGDNIFNVGATNLVADLSTATAAKINDIRYAFQLQKYLERSNFGSRFFEVLAVHYGVTSPDSRLQRPEYLGGKSCPIVVRTVLSQAGYDASSSQKVGQPGASSITYVDISGLFSKGFVEPGYVMILASTNHERVYSQGLLQEDTKFDRFEFYSPEFNNLGDQMLKKKHVMLTGDSSDEEDWGCQGHWDEYRYRMKRVGPGLDPAEPNALDFWTLGEKFTSRPSLSASFIQENRDCLSRCLVTGATGPDYIFDFYCVYQATREMSMYAIPGLIDHFGVI